MKRVKNADIADDLVQAAILRMIERQHQFEEGTNHKAWAFTVISTSTSIVHRSHPQRE